jgi:hypothetical protein
MVVDEVYKNIIYPELKAYVTTNSIYSPSVTKVYTEQSKVFPLITVNLSRVINNYGNLSYTEETYPFRIDINVYAVEKTVNGQKVSKITIADELSDLIETYFKSNYRVTINRQDDIDNIDGTVRRNFIRVNGVLDTKYGEDNYVIYPQ